MLKEEAKGKSLSASYKPLYLRQRFGFLEGMDSVLNLSGHFTPLYYGRDPRQANYEAIYGDWLMVGRDLERVMQAFESKHAEELQDARQRRLFNPDT